MKNFVLIIFSIFAINSSCFAFWGSNDCTDKTELDEIGGDFCTLKDSDGPITCIVTYGPGGGGLDCTLEGNIDKDKFDDSEELSLDLEGKIERRLVNDRICYFYEAPKSRAVSCVKVQFK